MRQKSWSDERDMTTLGELISLQRGYDLPESVRRPGVVPVVGSAGITGYHDTVKAKGPGVTLGRSGASYGKVFYVREDYWPHNAALFVTDFKGNDPLFVRYLLESLDFSSLNSGSAQQSLNRNFVYGLPVAKTPLPEQQRIAGVLSAYDDLIENNQRRIRILEEMARALYREWFVEFRFPGHFTSQWVKSSLGDIPARWRVRKLGEILELHYGKALKQEIRREGAVPVYGSSGIVGMHDTALVSGPGIVVGRKGNVGSVFWSDESFYPIDTVYFVVSKLPLRFLYHDLLSKTFLNSDAAVPGLNRTQAYSMETVVPPLELLSRFTLIADDFGKQALLLHAQCGKLRTMRDLLLPYLMKG